MLQCFGGGGQCLQFVLFIGMHKACFAQVTTAGSERGSWHCEPVHFSCRRHTVWARFDCVVIFFRCFGFCLSVHPLLSRFFSFSFFPRAVSTFCEWGTFFFFFFACCINWLHSVAKSYPAELMRAFQGRVLVLQEKPVRDGSAES